MANENVSINMPQDLVKPIIEAKVAAAISEALGGSDAIVERMVALALSKKVDSSGKVSEYSSYNTHNFIEVVCANTIREAAKKAINEFVASQAPKIEAEIRKQLTVRNKDLAKAFVASLVDGVRTNVTFTVDANVKN